LTIYSGILIISSASASRTAATDAHFFPLLLPPVSFYFLLQRYCFPSPPIPFFGGTRFVRTRKPRLIPAAPSTPSKARAFIGSVSLCAT